MTSQRRSPVPVAPPPAVEAPRTEPTLRTAPQAISAKRRSARALVSVLLRTAASLSSLRHAARALEVHPSHLEHLADPEHPAAIALGDVLVLPPKMAEAVLVAALAHVQAQRLLQVGRAATSSRVLHLVRASAELAGAGARAIEDGQVDPRERSSLLELAAAVQQQIGALARDLAEAL